MLSRVTWPFCLQDDNGNICRFSVEQTAGWPPAWGGSDLEGVPLTDQDWKYSNQPYCVLREAFKKKIQGVPLPSYWSTMPNASNVKVILWLTTTLRVDQWPLVHQYALQWLDNQCVGHRPAPGPNTAHNLGLISSGVGGCEIVQNCKLVRPTTRIQIEIPEIRLLHCSSELRFRKSTLVVYQQHCLRSVLGLEAKDARDGIK